MELTYKSRFFLSVPALLCSLIVLITAMTAGCGEEEKFNKEKFQEENPVLYDKYVTMDGKKSAYITIRIKW